jgi:hypothetical protein
VEFGSPVPQRPVPYAVALDLLLCRRPVTLVLCNNDPAAGLTRAGKVHPRRCDTLGGHDSFASGANLAGLRWFGWGRATATATGIELGYHLPFAHVPVHVSAYRRRRADCGDYVYTRLRVTSKFGTTLRRFPARCAD